MRTLETRDDFDFKVLFDPSERDNQVPDIRRIPKPIQGSATPAELVDTKEMNRAFLQDTNIPSELGVTNKFTQHEKTEPLSGMPAESYRSNID